MNTGTREHAHVHIHTHKCSHAGSTILINIYPGHMFTGAPAQTHTHTCTHTHIHTLTHTYACRIPLLINIQPAHMKPELLVVASKLLHNEKIFF
jgi:hypothetical protein